MNRLLASRTTIPAVGFTAVVIATVIATIVVFPERPSPQGALLLPAIVLSIGILFVPAVRLISGSGQLTNAENFVCFGYVFWLLLDLLQGAYDLRDASDRALRMALVSIGVSAALMWVGLAGREWHAPNWLRQVSKQPLETRTIVRLVPICFVLGMLNYAYAVDFDIPVMFSYLGGNRWAAPWTRGQLGGWNAFIDQMPYFGYVLPSLTALLISRRGLWRFESLFAIFCSVIMLLFLSQGGGRRIIGVTFGAALLVWVQTHPGIRLKNVIIIFVGATAMAWASQFMLNIRQQGIEAFLERGSDLDYLHVDDNFLRLAQVIDLVPQSHPHVGWQQLIYTVVRPVPRVLWPDKPIDPGFDLPAAVGLKGLSLTTSIIGEWYLAFGWLAVAFGGWFHGRLAKAADALRREGQSVENPIVYALAVMVLIAGMRSMLDLVIMSYALVAWWAVNRYLARRRHVH